MALETLGAGGSLVLDPLYALWASFVSIVPGFVLALLILVLGYCVAYLVGHVVRAGLEKVGLERKLKQAQLSRTIGHTHLSALIGELLKWFVFILFLQVAVETLNLGGLSALLDSFVRWLPNLLFAVIIFFAGLALAHYIDIKINEYSKMKGIRVLSTVIKVVVIFLVLIIGLEQIGIDVSVLKYGFLVLLGALGLGIALALGVGLGLGLRSSAENFVKDIRKEFK